MLKVLICILQVQHDGGFCKAYKTLELILMDLSTREMYIGIVEVVGKPCLLIIPSQYVVNQLVVSFDVEPLQDSLKGCG